jgi:hypothetical protein
MARISSKSITLVLLFTAATSIIISFAISSNVYAQQDHSIASNTYPINAAESVSIPFTIPDGVTNAYLSGTILITGGIFSDIDFSIVNSNTGVQVMTQTYHSQGNIGLYLPAGSYNVVLHNGAILAGEVHTATLTLNVNY